MNNDISYCAYIQSWNEFSNVEPIVLKTEKEFIKYNQNYRVINSSNTIYEKSNWINVGNIWYYRSFYEALKDFDFSNDYFLFITGDFEYNDWNGLFEKSKNVLNNYKPKSFSIYHNNSIFLSDKASLGDFEKDNTLEYSVIQDGVFVFYHKDVAKVLLEYFKYLDDIKILYNIKYGWGLDFIASAICIYQKGYMLKDKHFLGFNRSSGIVGNSIVCNKEMNIIFNTFYDFCNKNNIDENIFLILDKIKQRVGLNQEIKYLSYNDFYAN